MGLIILNAILATGLLYSIASPFLAHIQNKIAGYHNLSIQYQAGTFSENGNSDYNFPQNLINRGNFPGSNNNQDYDQNPIQEEYPADQPQYPEEHSEINPITNTQQFPISYSQQYPTDNQPQNPIDNIQYPEYTSQQNPIDNSQQNPIDNTQQDALGVFQQNPIDDSQEYPKENSEQNPINNSQQDEELQPNPINDGQQNPMGNSQEIPIEMGQQTPKNDFKFSLDISQGNPTASDQQIPIDISEKNPIVNGQRNAMDNLKILVDKGRFGMDNSQQSEDSEYQMDVVPENVSEGFGANSGFLSLQYLPPRLGSSTVGDLESSSEDDDLSELNMPIKPQDCSTKSCILTAANYLKHMNESVDPCEDFFEFACGNYAAHNPLKGDDTTISELSKAKDSIEANLRLVLEEPIAEDEPEHFKSVKKYYKACTDEDKINSIGLEKIKSHLENLGGWPVTGEENDHDWVYVIYGLSKLGISPNYLFEFYVDTDYKNTTIRILSLSPAEYPLQRETIVNGKSDKNVKAYLNYMIETAKLFGATDEVARNDMELALDFEIALANNSKSIEEIRSNLTALYNVYSIAELEKEFPEFPWFIYINTLTPKNLQIVKDVNIILTEPEYARKLFALLKTTPKRTVINYIIWRAIYDLAKFLNADMRNLNQNFFAEVLGKQTKSPRHTECIESLRDRLNPLISALYVTKYFNVKSKEAAIVLTKYIKSTFKTILNRTNWSAKDKATAVEKAEAIHEHIGFPEELLDNSKLESIYGTLDIKEDDYLYSSLKLLEFKRDFEFNRLFEPVNKTFWMDHAESADANAYYNVAENSIILPAGILQGSYFNSHVPMFVNFAAIGSVIGHEITHGFDDVGHQFNKNGDLGSIWSEEAEKDFAEKKQCVIDQFNMFTVFGKPYNGGRTVGENLADFGGQKTAYISYIKWMRKYGIEPKLPGLNYTIKQQYWIAGANIWCSNEREETLKYKATVDTHALMQFRVNAPLSNIPNFAIDFNCPVGSKMNPAKKCTPW